MSEEDHAALRAYQVREIKPIVPPTPEEADRMVREFQKTRPVLNEVSQNTFLRQCMGGSELIAAVRAALRVPIVVEDRQGASEAPGSYATGWNAAVDAVRQGIGTYLVVSDVAVPEPPTPAQIALEAPPDTVIRVTGTNPSYGALVYEKINEVWWACNDGVHTTGERLASSWAENPQIKVTVIYDPERS
jgi:hypothetical protein